MASRPTYASVNSDLPLTPDRGSTPMRNGAANESSHLAAGSYTPHDPYTPASKGMQPRTKRLLLVGAAVLVFLALVVAVPVGVTQSRKSSNSSLAAAAPDVSHSESPASQAETKTAAAAAPSASPTLAIAGKTGSLVKLSNGSDVTYTNTFGGDWVWDETDPYGQKTGALGGGRAQEWSPRSGEDWKWGVDQVRGVNLGGWLVLEPFIVPSIFEDWRNSTGKDDIVDEWTLSAAMGTNLEKAMTEHYDTFITEQDFMEIAAAGLNWVRIPIGYWAIETTGDEPFLPKVSWTYFLKAVEWARKYGIRINLDLHALPGSQNGWNHSGRQGTVNFMAHVMGLANAERSLSYMQTLAEFVSQPEIAPVVPLFGFVNEIQWSEIGEVPIKSFYAQALKTIRETTGIGAGKGPYLAYHDGFQGASEFSGFLSGGDRLVLDMHPYMAFDPSAYTQTLAAFKARPCNWADAVNTSRSATGVTIGGEFSGATNDCGFWLNGIRPGGASESVATCGDWDDYRKWDATKIADIQSVVLASMDAVQDFFFWTWKIGVSKTRGFASSPDWHYRLGLQEGWIPKDPRQAAGICAAQAGSAPFDGTFPPSATGGGNGVVDAAQLALYPWPPATLLNADGPAANLPRYTATGPMPTLPAPTFAAATANATVGSGWGASPSPAFVPISECTYPDEYGGDEAVPASYAECTGGAAAPAATATATRTTTTRTAPAVPPTVPTDTASVAEDRRSWPTAPPLKRAARVPR